MNTTFGRKTCHTYLFSTGWTAFGRTSLYSMKEISLSQGLSFKLNEINFKMVSDDPLHLVEL